MAEVAAPSLAERLQALADSIEGDLDPRMKNSDLEPMVKMVFDLREASRRLLAADREYVVLNDKGLGGLLDAAYPESIERNESLIARLHGGTREFEGEAVELILRPEAR